MKPDFFEKKTGKELIAHPLAEEIFHIIHIARYIPEPSLSTHGVTTSETF